METFLNAVAKAYVRHDGDISDYCFVLPNKRAVTFFMRSLARAAGNTPIIAPQVLDEAGFIRHLSGRDVASRIELLFRTYKLYRALPDKGDINFGEQDVLDFERFAGWGETAISDFDVIDQSAADAMAILKNVRDLRDISSTFLSEEQMDAIEQYLGVRPAMDDVEGFWRTVLPIDETPEDGNKSLKERFVLLWSVLGQLYTGLHENLAKDNLTTKGGSFRLAMENVEEVGSLAEAIESGLLPWQRVVFVGFNYINGAEERLFHALSKMKACDGRPYAEFVWDATGPVLDGEAGSHNIAASTLRHLRKRFPAPQWISEYLSACGKQTMPAFITVSAAPSNAAQVKVAASVISEWIGKIGLDGLRDGRAAIVVPDENLLLPLIHSLPPEVKNFNLTMGYSLRYTAVASFVYLLRRLQSHPRGSDSHPAYFHEDVKLFLSHPLVHAVIGSRMANSLNGKIASSHQRVIALAWLMQEADNAADKLGAMLQPLGRDWSVGQTVAYLDSVLETVDNALASGSADTGVVKSRLERMFIAHYRQALAQLLDSVTSHGIHMRPAGVFHLADRLLAGESVNFKGEPLRGLQIMGLLETRALDFDHVMVLSMNDKVMPRKSGGRSFLPASVRHGYCLPVQNLGEELYSYYFYRLISRADDVNLIYDARTGEGMRSGGKSRFIMQLDMLYAPGKVKEKTYGFNDRSDESEPLEVKKTPDVVRKLKNFLQPGEMGWNLSASALMNYSRCPILFYYKNVAGIIDDLEPADYLDAATQGTIVHEILQNLYIPDEEDRKQYLCDRIVLTREDLQNIYDDTDRIKLEMCRMVNRKHYRLPEDEVDTPLPPSIYMTIDGLVEWVRNVLRHDMEIAPIELVGCEIGEVTRLKVGDAPEVNISYSFDRVDVVGGRMRLIDYKTGYIDVEAPAGMEAMMAGDAQGHYLIQLFTYARLLRQQAARMGDDALAREAQLMVYDATTDEQVDKKGKKKDTERLPKLENEIIESASQIEERFEEALAAMLNEIFDDSIPFRHATNTDNCSGCRYRFLCGKD